MIDRAIPAGRSERGRFFRKLVDEAPEWLKSIQQASLERGTDKFSTRQIDVEIAAARRERRAKAKSPA